MVTCLHVFVDQNQAFLGSWCSSQLPQQETKDEYAGELLVLPPLHPHTSLIIFV